MAPGHGEPSLEQLHHATGKRRRGIRQDQQARWPAKDTRKRLFRGWRQRRFNGSVRLIRLSLSSVPQIQR